MTAEEILNEFIKGDISRDYDEENRKYHTVTLDTALKAIQVALNAQQKQDKWIKVSEDWPKDGENVLWCKHPVNEPYYFGSSLDEDFPENYYTHFTRNFPTPPID